MLLVRPITLIINQILNTGIFPDKLKVAKIIPPVMIRNALALGEGHATCSQLAPKQFALIFDDVTFLANL